MFSHKFLHLQVMSRMAEPYFQLKKNCTEQPCEEDEYPDDLYEGFSVDLVRNIFEIMREEHNYTYKFVADKFISYGKFDNVTKKWDGLIGKLLDKVSYEYDNIQHLTKMIILVMFL